MNFLKTISPISNSSKVNLSGREKKYITCLQLVQKVLERELKVTLDREYFILLGRVSSFIDKSLDALDLHSKHKLAQNYEQLFDDIVAAESFSAFVLILDEWITNLSINNSSRDGDLNALYHFIQIQKKLELTTRLKSFGIQIITLSICKQESIDSDEILATLRAEGQEVITLLRDYLFSCYGIQPKIIKALSLLTDYEQILNLADDFLDISKDRKEGKLHSQLPFTHIFHLGFNCVSKVLTTSWKYPRQCFYYYPFLSVYFLLNFRRRYTSS